MATKTEREAPEIGSAVRRMIRALVRRAAEGDTEALEQLAALEGDVGGAVTIAGEMMHSGERMAGDQSYSYTELAAVMGISRQAARQRFTQLPSPAAVRYWCAL
jgi:hypothetical protein